MKTNGRQSKNVIDKRPKPSDLFTLTDSREDHLRQIYQPKVSKNITRVSNRIVNADKQAAKGPGMTKLRAQAGKPVQGRFALKKGK